MEEHFSCYAFSTTVLSTARSVYHGLCLQQYTRTWHKRTSLTMVQTVVIPRMEKHFPLLLRFGGINFWRVDSSE